MPWRLVKFIAVFGALLLFIILNLDNRTDISLGVTFRNVPVFLIVFCSVFAGMLLTVPFIVSFLMQTRRGGPPKKTPKPGGKGGGRDKPEGGSGGRWDGPVPPDFKDYGID